ncbi:hypothetical protein GR131_16295 [Streptomyces sp. GF20]|uniref:hypothetical protein n=1 Tax=Streptomyces sp. GF20 TaxID=2692235 RepID=UPI0013199703|nr:hypothetical protein [Streptomyces sp. GF20]QHC16881.1 hypothetical protein GR131_16295 [Streptomyces sp. GF20]
MTTDQLDTIRLDAVALVTRLALRLRTERPTEPMRDGTRLALLLRFSEARCGYGTARAEHAERAARDLAPRVDRDITRGEYALLLDQVIGGAR